MNYRNINFLPRYPQVILAAFTSLCLQGGAAQWGSIRANNHSEHEFRGEFRGAARSAVPVPRENENRVHEGERDRFGGRESVVVPERRVQTERRWGEEPWERRHLDIDEERRHGYFWAGISPGMYFCTLPSGYVPIYAGGTPYYYYDGA